MTISVEELHRALGGEISTGKGGRQVVCPGPGHSHKDRSLAVMPADNENGFIVYSHAGDEFPECADFVKDRLGLPKFKPGMNGSGGHTYRTQQPPKPTNTYDYIDEEGVLLFQVQKFVFGDTKKYKQRQPNPNKPNDWINNIDGVRRVIYRLPEVIEQIALGHPVYVVEGEKDVDALWSIGIAATTNPHGAGKWRDEYSRFFHGATIYLIPDNDSVGRKHVADVRKSLEQHAAGVHVIELGLTEPSADVSNWLAAGGNRQKLDQLAEESELKEWEFKDTGKEESHEAQKEPHIEAIPLSYFCDLKQAANKDWAVKNVIALGECSGWIAPPGYGKSGLMTSLFVHLAGGIEWRGYRIKQPMGGLYFALERADLVKRRLIAHRLRDNLPEDLPIAVSGSVIDLMDRGCVDLIVDAIKRAEDHTKYKIGVIAIDTWSKGIAAGGGDENQAKDQNIALANLRRVLERANVHIATIGHTGKDESRGERGSNAKLADVDLQVQITGSSSTKTAIVKKANDQQEGPLTTFQLEPFDFGLDPDGDPFRTYIVSNQEIHGAGVGNKRLSDKQQLAVEALAEAILEHGTLLASGQKGVSLDQWQNELHRRAVIDPDAGNPRARFSELCHSLRVKRVIGVLDKHVWLAMAAQC